MKAAALILALAASGRAADLSGLVSAGERSIPLTAVALVLRGGGRELRTATDASGSYRFTGLDTAVRYTLETSAEGFRPLIREGVAPGSLDLTLVLADVRQSVVVTAGVIRLESGAPASGRGAGPAELRELPSANRSVAKFALLDPHVRQVVGLGGDGANGSRLSINAGSYRHTSYLLDGVINYDWIYANGPYQPVSLGATEEVEVISNPFTAQLGNTTLGTVKMVTRSGSNGLHGDAFAILRPSGIQAAPPLSPRHVPNEREQWGASVGGTLRRDRTFYFLNYEGVHQDRGAYIQSPRPDFFTGTTGEYYGLARVDHHLSPEHLLSLRLNGGHYRNTNANDRVSGYNQPSYGRLERTQSWGGQFSDRWFVAGVLNQLRLNLTSYFPDSAVPLAPSVGVVRPSYSTEGYSTTNWVHSRITDLSDTVAITRGAHTVRIGAEYTRVTALDYSSTPFGTYTFAAGAAVAGEHPMQYAQTFGAIHVRYGETAVNAFVQDDVRVAPRLTANLGLRLERQSVTSGLNFAPRLGLAWDPAGNGRTVVRAGAGVFYDQLYLYVYRRFYLAGASSPQRSYTIPWGAAGFPEFPASLAAAPAGASAALLNLYLPGSPLRNPYSLQYGLSVERQLGGGFTGSVSGTYAHTLRQYRVNDINHPAPLGRTAPGQTRSGAAADATRPYSAWLGLPVRDVGIIENSASSLYSALDLGLRRRQGRLTLEAHYLLASSAAYSMFYADANSGIPNEWTNWGSAERAPSDFFQHHRLAGSAGIELPFATRLGLVGIAASGMPVNPLTGSDNNGDTYASDRPVGFGRNSFRGPAQASLDLSFGKLIPLQDRLLTELRLEALNVFNRNNYITVNNVYGEGPAPRAAFLSPVAGIQNTDPSRQLQLSLRFRW